MIGNEEATEGDEAVTQKAMDSAKHFGSEYDIHSLYKEACFFTTSLEIQLI